MRIRIHQLKLMRIHADPDPQPWFELPEGGDEELGCLTVGADGPGHGHPVVLVQGGVHLVKQVEGRRVTLLYTSSKTEYLE